MTRILSLDDEPEMVGLMGLILRRAGYDHVGATDNDEALSILRSEPIDLFTQDLMRPGMDGWEFYWRMKADDRLKDMPVIIITAKAQTIDQFLGLRIAEVDSYITKPFGPQELVAGVEQVLRRHSKPLPTEEERERGRAWAATVMRGQAQLPEEVVRHCVQLLDEMAASLPNVRRDGRTVLIHGRRGCYRVTLDTGCVTRLSGASGFLPMGQGKLICIVPKLHRSTGLDLCLPFEDANPNIQRIISTVLMPSADQDIRDETILRQLR